MSCSVCLYSQERAWFFCTYACILTVYPLSTLRVGKVSPAGYISFTHTRRTPQGCRSTGMDRHPLSKAKLTQVGITAKDRTTTASRAAPFNVERIQSRL